jgi:hypothetical protein
MGNFNSARPSPEIRAGVLCFYEGDRFSLQLSLDLRDDDGEPVELLPEDKIKVVIYDMPTVLWEKGYTGVKGNMLELAVDDELGGLLRHGEYKLRIVVHHGETVTTVVDAEVIVWK